MIYDEALTQVCTACKVKTKFYILKQCKDLYSISSPI